MKSKKRKTTAKVLPFIKQAIRENEVYIRQSTVDNGIYHNDYDVSFGGTFYERGAIQVFVTVDDLTGKITAIQLRGHGKLTKQAHNWLEQELDKLIIMHKIGAYQHPEDNGFRCKGQIRYNPDRGYMEIWTGYGWIEHTPKDAKRKEIHDAIKADQPKPRKRKHLRNRH